MLKRTKRAYLLGILLPGLGAVIALILYAFRGNIQLYFTPSQLWAGRVPHNQLIRIGGIVKRKSFFTDAELRSHFILSDGQREIAVEYRGILPDLFREGQAAITLGRWGNGIFHAKEVLAKHDEKYRPRQL